MDMKDIIEEAEKRAREMMSGKIPLEDIETVLESSRNLIKITWEMQSKSQIYINASIDEVLTDMDGSMWAVASSLSDGGYAKTQKHVSDGLNLALTEKDVKYHLLQMFKHFMAYKSLVLVAKSKNKK